MDNKTFLRQLRDELSKAPIQSEEKQKLYEIVRKFDFVRGLELRGFIGMILKTIYNAESVIDINNAVLISRDHIIANDNIFGSIEHLENELRHNVADKIKDDLLKNLKFTKVPNKDGSVTYEFKLTILTENP